MMNSSIGWGIAHAPVAPPDDLMTVRLYRDWIPQIAPPRLQNPLGQVFLAALGAEMDESLSRLITGIRARYPRFSFSDALNLLGRARQVERYPGETDADYAARVAGARNYWRLAGTTEGMLLALQQLGYTGHVHPWSQPRQSEFDVTLTPGRRTYNGSAAELQRIRRVVRAVKKADSELFRIFYRAQPISTAWGQAGLSWGQAGLGWGPGRSLLYQR